MDILYHGVLSTNNAPPFVVTVSFEEINNVMMRITNQMMGAQQTVKFSICIPVLDSQVFATIIIIFVESSSLLKKLAATHSKLHFRLQGFQ